MLEVYDNEKYDKTYHEYNHIQSTYASNIYLSL